THNPHPGAETEEHPAETGPAVALPLTELRHRRLLINNGTQQLACREGRLGRRSPNSRPETDRSDPTPDLDMAQKQKRRFAAGKLPSPPGPPASASSIAPRRPETT